MTVIEKLLKRSVRPSEGLNMQHIPRKQADIYGLQRARKEIEKNSFQAWNNLWCTNNIKPYFD